MFYVLEQYFMYALSSMYLSDQIYYFWQEIFYIIVNILFAWAVNLWKKCAEILL